MSDSFYKPYDNKQFSHSQVNKTCLTWNKNIHLLSFSSAPILALIHPCVLPVHVPQGQNTGCGAALHNLVGLTTVLNVVHLEVWHIISLELPGGLP